MPLTLVTGPANSARARVVLDRYRAQLARGPILVVPTAADAAHYRRELAESRLILGARVESFGGLMRELAARAGLGVRPLGEVARQRVVATAIRQAPLELLRPSAAAPGFLQATTRLVAELGGRRIEPQRLTAALRAWAPGGRRRAYCDEVAAIYAGYRRHLERLGRVDREQLEAAVLDAIRIDPSRWGRTPVLLYGFDDFDPLQLDAVETLARAADVVVSLPYEAGRVALAGRAATFETLRPLAAEVIVAAPGAEHYDGDSRRVLHQLERALFEEDAEPGPPGPAVGLLEGATERGELELVAAEIDALLAAGYRAEDVAVVMRSVAGRQALIGEVFGERGIPVAPAGTVRFGDTAVGRGLLGLLRAACGDGRAEDLLAWLRAPGVLERPQLADRFEAKLRRRGVTGAAPARELWDHFPLELVDRVAAAAGRGPQELLERTAAELERLLAAPVRRRAEVLDGARLGQARVVAAAAAALAELRELTAADRRLGPSATELIELLGELELAAPPPPGGVLVCDAPALRARRVRALFVCDVGEGAFPAGRPEPPFFSAQERAEIAQASGLLLGRFEDALAGERYLFYATVTRAESRLRVSWHRTGDDGAPRTASAFVDDVRAAFAPAPQTRAQASDWDFAEQPRAAGGVRGGDGGAPLGHLRDVGVLAALGERAAESPSSLEAWTACPAGWFVERLLAAEPLEPEGEPLARGTVAHAVLARVVAQLCAGGPLAAADAATVGELVRAALSEHAGGVSANGERDRAARRRLEADLERYLCGLGGVASAHQPQHFELAFGLAGAAHPAVELAGGALRLRGRIDRVDVDRAGATAIVHDYKSGEVVGQAKWEERGRLALALYMLAARELLGVEVVGGLYQPVRGADLRPRGALRADVEPDLAGYATDRLDAGELEAALAGALERALRAAGELRAGALESRPATCTRGGVCRHPSICREAARV